MKRRYTLFHLDGERGLRGGERQLLYLASHLRAAGHENVIVCRAGVPLDREARRRRFKTLNLPFLGEWDIFSARRLRRAASQEDFPILHAHTAHTAALARLASLWGGPPWVVHRRVDFHLRGSLSRIFKYSAAHRVVAVSKSIRRILVEDGVEESKIEVVPDCVPATEAEARLADIPEGPLRPAAPEERAKIRQELSGALGIPAEAFWIGNLAALVGHKDQATLLRSAAQVLRREPKARFLLIGSGPLERELRNLADELIVSQSVHFVGQVSDPRPWLQAMDLYVQSSWGEGMGSVLLEAMACGVPIVATTAGGIPEVLEDGRSALLVPPRSPEKLADAVCAALSDRESAAKRARAAESSLENFSMSRIGERTETLYRELFVSPGRNGGAP